MATLLDIRTAIKGALIIEGTEEDALIDNAIRAAIRLMQRKRFWFLHKITTVTLSSGALSVSVPDDFAMMDTVGLIDGTNRYTENNGFALLEYDNFKDQYLTTNIAYQGRPLACSLFNKTLYASHAPSADTTLEFTYYKKDITLPTADGDMSVWFDEGYDVIRSLAQYVYEKEWRGNPDADQAITLTYQKQLKNDHQFYERGVY